MGKFQPPITELADSGTELSPKLQLRPEPEPPTEAEQQILDLLWTEYQKSDAVARAAARFEADVHEKLLQQRVQDGLSEDEAGEMRRVFSADDFNTTFRQLLQLRMEIQLLQRLGLQEYEQAIMQERIHAVFGSSGPTKGKKAITLDQSFHLGTPETHQVQDLKQRGRRRG